MTGVLGSLLDVTPNAVAMFQSVLDDHRLEPALAFYINRDTVAVFAHGPIGLCVVPGTRPKGATTIIGIDAVGERMNVTKQLGATHEVNFKDGDEVYQIMALTDDRGIDVSIEALCTQGNFESALRILRPGGRLSSLGVCSSDLRIALDAFAAGLGDYSIITTLCPGGKERMRRVMAVVESGGGTCCR